MDNPQDCLVTSSQDIVRRNGPSTSGEPAEVYQIINRARNRKEQFPWFLSFQKQCRAVLGTSSMKDLLNVITAYTEHISKDVEASYSKPNRAAKLKSNMISVINFFHHQYVLMKQPFKHSAYLEKMSNLLTLYFDMEVKASRRGKESVKKITSKLISALFIILNDSSEYILDAILKARFTVKSYSEICIPIFKMVTDLPQSQEMNYVRSLLVFKLWKRMLPCREERNSINRLAVAKLNPPPAQVLEFLKRGVLSSVLPVPPPDKKSITRFYMTKKFNVRESIKAFLKLEADLKLNDFTSALDGIKFFDEEVKEEEVMTEEINFDKDYSLLESIWIDISHSPSTPDQPSFSSPSTPGSSPLKHSPSDCSRTYETDKAALSRVKKSLFPSKTAKRNKQTKNKVKEKSKKKKEDLVIDLCKDNDENCSEVTQDTLVTVKSRVNTLDSTVGSLDSNVETEVNCKGFKLSSKSVKNNHVSKFEMQSKTIKNKLDPDVSTVCKSYSSCESSESECDTPSQSSIEIGFTNDVLLDTTSKLLNEPERLNTTLKHETIDKNQEKKLLVLEPNEKLENIKVLAESNNLKSVDLESITEEPSLVTESIDMNKVETSKSTTEESRLVTGSIDMNEVETSKSTTEKSSLVTESIDMNKVETYKSTTEESSLVTESIDMNKVETSKSTTEESSLVTESIDMNKVETYKSTTEESSLVTESIDMNKVETSKSTTEESSLVTESTDINKVQSSKSTIEESSLLTETIDMNKVETSKNKIVISCKNFSRIDFKHEEVYEKSDKFSVEEPEELISSNEVFEDPIFKDEILKEESLHFKEDESSLDKILSNKNEQFLQSEEASWNNCSVVNSPGDKLSTENSLQNNVNNDCRNPKLDLNNEISCDTKTMFLTSFHEETISSNEKEPNKQDKKSSEEVPSEISVNAQDTPIHSLGKETFCERNRTQDANISKQNINTVNNKIVTIRDIHGKHLQIIVTTDNKHDLRSKSIQKSLSAIQKLKKGESSSILRVNHNQESSDVSSSSVDVSHQIQNNETSNLSNSSLDAKQESMSCKVKKEHSKEFSSCMRNSEPLHEDVSFQLKHNCDKNTQVPSKTFSHLINKPDFYETSHSSAIPKDNQLKNQDFNLQKGLNTCLLHKILGEEDCLKSGCLLKSSVPENVTQVLNKRDFTEVSLKQELENSTELPSDTSTPSIPSLWNPSAGIKVEKDNENSRRLECIEMGIGNMSSEFFVRSVTEACNFKELDYNIGSECDNFTANCEFESDNEDRNLVIDEDIDSIKDHNESEDLQSNYGIDYMQNNSSNNLISPDCSNKKRKKVNDQLIEENLICALGDRPTQANNHQEKIPRIDNTIKENEPVQREISGKHKLPRIVENNMKTSYLRNSYVSEASIDPSIKYRPLTNNEMLHPVGNSTSCVSAQHYREENTSVVAKHYIQPKIVKQSGGNVNIGHVSPDCRVFTPQRVSQVNDSNCVRINNRDPRLGPVTANSNGYRVPSNVNAQSNPNNQPSLLKSLQNVGAVNQPIFATEIAKCGSPRLVSSPGCYETYSQFSMGSKLSVPSNKNRASPAERYSPRNLIGNENYKGMEKMRQNLESPKRQESCNNNSHSKVNVYAELSNPKGNSNKSLLKYNNNDHQTMKTGEPVYETINVRDPIYDFEFNVFPIAQEIEICSGSENLVGEWLYPVSSEMIGHPDWPIANEQNVIDSSGSYAQPSDQYMFSMMNGDEGCAISKADQSFYAPLELQQIDKSYPKIIGKNINEKLNLHLRTIEGDSNLCCSQKEFKEFYLSRDVSPTIPVPFPPQGRTDNLNSTVRCPCDQCSDNHKKLLSNYNILTHFRNSKLKPQSMYPKSDEASFSEKDPNGEFDSSLPLKKRKTLTNSKASDELMLPSYPNTPMISIAQLELTGYEQSNQVIVPNPQSQWRDSVSYNPLNLVQSPSIEPFDGQAKGKRKASKRRKSSR